MYVFLITRLLNQLPKGPKSSSLPTTGLGDSSICFVAYLEIFPIFLAFPELVLFFFFSFLFFRFLFFCSLFFFDSFLFFFFSLFPSFLLTFLFAFSGFSDSDSGQSLQTSSLADLKKLVDEMMQYAISFLARGSLSH